MPSDDSPLQPGRLVCLVYDIMRVPSHFSATVCREKHDFAGPRGLSDEPGADMGTPKRCREQQPSIGLAKSRIWDGGVPQSRVQGAHVFMTNKDMVAPQSWIVLRELYSRLR